MNNDINYTRGILFSLSQVLDYFLDMQQGKQKRKKKSNVTFQM